VNSQTHYACSPVPPRDVVLARDSGPIDLAAQQLRAQLDGLAAHLDEVAKLASAKLRSVLPPLAEHVAKDNARANAETSRLEGSPLACDLRAMLAVAAQLRCRVEDLARILQAVEC